MPNPFEVDNIARVLGPNYTPDPTAGRTHSINPFTAGYPTTQDAARAMMRPGPTLQAWQTGLDNLNLALNGPYRGPGWQLAELPIGLDMSKSARMARAADQGFDTSKVYYHGTVRDFDSFKPGVGAGRSTKQGSKAVFVTDTPETANWYARTEAGETGNAVVYPLHVRAGRSWDFRNTDHVDEVLRYIPDDAAMDSAIGPIKLSKSEWRDELLNGDWGTIEDPIVQRAIQNAGFDSFAVREGRQVNVGVFEPSRLRSVNAAFDPKKKNSANILATVGAGMAVGAAANQDKNR